MEHDIVTFMTNLNKNSISFVGRLGSNKPEAQVRQAMANVTLEGLKPSDLSVKLAHSVALGNMTTDQAVNQLISSYGCHA